MKLISIASIVWLMMTCSVGYGQDNVKALADELVHASGIKAGLCVHLGCRDAALTGQLAAGRNLLVQGLDKDAAMVEQARRDIQAHGLNGRVSVQQASWRQPLPYPDSTVNLIVADDLPGLLADGLAAREILRVLTPNGVACLGQPAGPAAPSVEDFKAALTKAGLKHFEIVKPLGAWARLTKPLNPKTDEWRHYLHGPGRNNVSDDAAVGPATQLRWLNGPCYFNSQPGLISAGGLVFFGQWEWKPEGKAIQWMLRARDAYNGCLVWSKPLDYYNPQTLACDGRRLYLPLEGKLGAVDVRTGETVFTVPAEAIPADKPARCDNIGTVAVMDGVIVVRDKHRPVGNVYVVDADTQELLWKQRGIRTVAGEGAVYVSNAETLSAFDLRTGREKWQLPLGDLPDLEANANRWRADGMAELIQYAYGRLILFNRLKGRTQVYAVSAKDGKCLWYYDYSAKFGLVALSYPEELWLVTNGGGRGDGFQLALNAATGKETRRFDKLIPNSCATLRGTRNYLLGSPKGSSYYLNLSTLELTGGVGFRSQCAGEGGNQVPANGLQYYVPCWCQCGSQLRGLFALGSDELPLAISKDQPHPLIKGDAEAPPAVAAKDTDWPCCRKDVQRSNVTAAAGPVELVKLWEATLGQGRVSPITVANGLAYAADVEGLQLCALDSATGKERWRYLTGCRVDVPPTIEKGLCLFGGRDGWVYCLNAQTGQLIWKYRAAPADRQIVVSGRMESCWPVVGGVLVQDGLAYVAAGHSTGVDGGIYLHAMEPATGKCVKTANPRKVSMTADWLVGDGKDVYVNGHKWVPEITERLADHIHPLPKGLLQARGGQDIATLIWNMEPPPIELRRVQLSYGGTAKGDVVACAGDTTYAAGLDLGRRNLDAAGMPGNESQHYFVMSAGAAEWRVKLPLQFIAMVRAGKTLYCAGIPRLREADQKAQLWAISADDGKVTGTFDLDAWPVPDGLAVAEGRLYVALRNGKLLCLGK